jgi:hypothetical protein
MSIARILCLTLAAVIILATHSTPSFAEEVSLSYGGVQTVYTQQGDGGDDGENLWDYICSLLW